jgi:glycosyltransferase involved in cell wall biosynthesis
VEDAYYYLGGDALHTGIYVDLIRRLEDEGMVVGLVGRLRVSPNPLATWRAWRDRGALGPNRIETVRGSIRGEVHQVPVWNLLPGLSAPALERTLGLAADPARRVVVHTRQIVMARLALALKRRCPTLRVIAELEGDDLAEVGYKRTKAEHPTPWLPLLWALEHRYYEREERRILLESDAVICVSRKLKEVMVHRYSLTPRQAGKVHVVPTLASRREFHFDHVRRERARTALGVQDRFVVVYSGNLRSRWQVPEKLAEAFVAIQQVRPAAFFLVLTQEADRRHLEPLLSRAGVSADAVRMLSCPHEQVVDHLCASDVGLLLRERHAMNEVAAPGKFAEYVLSGLPIVMTEGLGDFSAPMRESEFDCVLPDLADTDDCRERIQRFCARDFEPGHRAAFSAWAAERYAVERITPSLAALYRTV